MADIDEQLRIRLKALRATPAPSHSPHPPPAAAPPAPPDHDLLSTRLASLEPPTGTSPSTVAVETKNIDQEMAHYLTLASTSPPTSLPSPIRDRKLSAALTSFERLPQLSAIEVTFSSSSSSAGGAARSEEEDQLLIQKLSDELRVEEGVRRRAAAGGGEEGEGGIEGLQERLKGIREFRAAVGRNLKEGEEEEGEEEGSRLGEPPSGVEVGEFERVRRRGRGSEESESESESEEESEESKSSEEEDSE